MFHKFAIVSSGSKQLIKNTHDMIAEILIGKIILVDIIESQSLDTFISKILMEHRGISLRLVPQ